MKTRFILVSLGTPGDVLPYLGVGVALRSRGHDVVVLANEHFRAETERAGLEFDPLGTTRDYDRFLGTPHLWDAQRCIEVGFDVLIRPHMESGYRLIERHYTPGRTVLVCSSFVFCGRVAAEKLGVPLVSVTLQPCSLFRNDVPPRTRKERLLGALAGKSGRRLYRKLRSREMDRMLGWVNDLRRDLGLGRAADIFYDWRYSPQGLLGLWPDAFFDGETTAPVEPFQAGFVTYEGSMRTAGDWKAVVDRLGERPIVFTLGTGMVQGEKFFRAAAEATTLLGRPGLLVTGHSEQIPDSLPEGVTHIERAPFSELLPRAGVFVHHGGIGSIARALLAATPQVVVPMAFDQFDNAALLRALGVGASMPFATLTADGLAQRIDSLLSSNAVADRCGRWSARLAADDPLEGICRYLEARIGLDAGFPGD